MTHRTRIIHTIGAMVAGGAERASVDLTIALRRAGHPVEFLAITNRQDNVGKQWQNWLEDEGIPIHKGPTPRLSIGSAMWFRKQLTAPDLAILHLHLSYAEMVYFGVRPLHRRQYGVVRKLANAVWPTDLRRRIPMHLSDIKHSIAAGKATQEFFEGHLKGEIHCIPNGRYFHTPPRDRQTQAAAQNKLQLDPGHKHFVCVGRMSGPTLGKDQKAQDILIKAWQLANCPNAQLHFLGEGNLMPELKEAAKSHQNIHFQGVSDTIDTWLTAADCFVLPSRWEGLPNAVVEAGALGLPLILSDIPPMREVGENNATYVPVDDANALALQINKVASSPTGTDNTNSALAQSVRSRFGIESRIPHYESLYQTIHPEPAAFCPRGESN